MSGATGAPLPDPGDPLLGSYWDAAARQELVVQMCTVCRRVQWPPRDTCGHCGPVELGWWPVAGRGVLFTWTVVHHSAATPPAPLPFAVGVVELDDVPARMLCRIRGVEPDDLRMDMAMEVAFEQVGGGVTLPLWQPASERTVQ